MKKLIFIAIVGIFAVACSLSTSNSKVDSTKVDSIVVDSTAMQPERPTSDSLK